MLSRISIILLILVLASVAQAFIGCSSHCSSDVDCPRKGWFSHKCNRFCCSDSSSCHSHHYKKCITVRYLECKSDKDCPGYQPYCGKNKCRPVTETCLQGENGIAACNRCFCVGNATNSGWGCTKIGCPKPFSFRGAVPCRLAPDLC
ncbi:uncharacterized protein LOC122389065 [Amphibalanus amphitrite]|uniref:uncharacterized protein LOC122389065 n=1 Tax=Amphibalanus amphitrite TaxID=1232801 RepID=UPI001C911BFE|nr:uncharacterized protein LOC122389065 [Amphibalanus amphitrite]